MSHNCWLSSWLWFEARS